MVNKVRSETRFGEMPKVLTILSSLLGSFKYKSVLKPEVSENK